MTLKSINRIYFSILIRFSPNFFGRYLLDDLDSRILVGARIGIFFGVGCFVMFVFMAATFACAGYANSVDMELRKKDT